MKNFPFVLDIALHWKPKIKSHEIVYNSKRTQQIIV